MADTNAAWVREIAALLGPSRLEEVAARFHGGRFANAKIAAALGGGAPAERTRRLTAWLRQALGSRRQLGDDIRSADLLERLGRQARVSASMAEQL